MDAFEINQSVKQVKVSTAFIRLQSTACLDGRIIRTTAPEHIYRVIGVFYLMCVSGGMYGL